MGKRGSEVVRRQPDPPVPVEAKILTLRGLPVLLDADLAEAYAVTTKALNQAVKRNAERFPADFRFRLTAAERDEVVTNCDHLARLRFSPTLPWAFTEHGALMAASVLSSPRAVEMSVFVVRAFVRLRGLARTHAELAKQLAALERRVTGHDDDLRQVLTALRELLAPPAKPRHKIGFGQEGS